ncbi:MAG: hypothetical protein WDN03_12250 [Rhizomicrobium sp.]
MKRFVLLALAALLAGCVRSVNTEPPPVLASAPAPAIGAAATAWVQYAPGGGAEVRALDLGGKGCPAATVDGHALALALRAAASADFPAICAAMLPAQARSLSVGGQALGVPVDDPQRILVLGDTGCRIKGTALQPATIPGRGPLPGCRVPRRR